MEMRIIFIYERIWIVEIFILWYLAALDFDALRACQYTESLSDSKTPAKLLQIMAWSQTAINWNKVCQIRCWRHVSSLGCSELNTKLWNEFVVKSELGYFDDIVVELTQIMLKLSAIFL